MCNCPPCDILINLGPNELAFVIHWLYGPLETSHDHYWMTIVNRFWMPQFPFSQLHLKWADNCQVGSDELFEC